MTTLAFVLHIIGGMVGLLSGLAAMFANKGGYLHRKAGDVFFVSMLAMAAFAAYLGVVVPGQSVNVFIAAFVSYLVASAWITIRRTPGTIGLAEKIGLAGALVLCAPFAVLSIQLALGVPPLFKSAVPFRGRL